MLKQATQLSFLVVASTLAMLSVYTADAQMVADAEIYKCVDADGNVAYQQTPCPVLKEEPEAEELPEPLEQLEEEEVLQEPVASNQTREEVEACKDPLRGAIDEIEAEMLRGFSPEQGDDFKVQLRTLTQEMRTCG